MDQILPLPREEIVRQSASLWNFDSAYQQHMLDLLEQLVKEGKYDIETIKTRCCVDVDEETGEVNGFDLSGLELNGVVQGSLCIGVCVPIGELTAEQWISMRVLVPKRKETQINGSPYNK